MKNAKQHFFAVYLTIFIGFTNVFILHGQISNDNSEPSTSYLVDILTTLKEEKKVTFLYKFETLEGIQISTPYDKTKNLKKILKKILPSVGLKFKKVGKYNYVIRKSRKYQKLKDERLNPQNALSIGSSQPRQLKTKKISGTVRGENETLVGATVRVKNSDIGTTTNEQGEYVLDIPKGDQVLVVSYIGFEDQEIITKNRVRENIYLKNVSTLIDEIIITAVGIEANKRTLGYTTDNFDIEYLNRSGEANLVSALNGKSAGVWINTASGSPGASASIFIRGLRSVNGTNKPLFILDGLPIDNSTIGNSTGGVDVSNRLIDVNNHDIEKITILKGASATSLYGIRAANGAIIMTSKKGNLGSPKITFNSSWGLNSANQLPPRQNIYAQGIYQNGTSVYSGPEDNTASSYGPSITELEFDGDPSYPYDQHGRLVPLGQGDGTSAINYDPYKTFFVQGQTLENHLGISGGTRRLDYYFSFGQFRETGIVPRSSYNRYNLKGTFDLRLNEKFDVGMSTHLTHSKGIRMKRGSLLSGIPLGLYRNPITFDIGNGQTGNSAANFEDAYIFDNGTQRAYRGNGRYDNPFWSINRNPFEDQVNRLIQQVHFKYRWKPWFKIQYKIGLDQYTDNRKNSFDINSGTHRLGQVELFDIRYSSVNSDLILTIEKQLSKNWNVKTTFGHNYYTSEFTMVETIGEELEKQGVLAISNAINSRTEDNLLRKKVSGIYSDIKFRYKNILYLNFTGRNDWSSTLPKKNNSFFYPGINIGFEFTELFNWTDARVLSYGKLRASASQVGNDAGRYLTDTYFEPAIVNGDDMLPNTNFPAFGVSAFERSGIIGNPNLKPETTNSYEIGVDSKWFKGRAQLDLTWYKSINTDQIIETQISATSGFLNVPINAGTIKNEGVEVSLKINPIRKKHFKWDAIINFSKFNSIVTDLPQNNSGIILASFSNISSMILEGQPYGVMVGTSIKRDDLGQIIVDHDGFPKVNETHTIIGNPNPDWIMGITNSITWKNLTLNSLMDIRKGGDIWNGTQAVMSYLGVSEISGKDRTISNYVFDGVTESGETNTTPVDFANPANGMEGIYWRRYGFLGLAEQNIEDGSWIRLRELSLAYRFSPAWGFKTQPNFSLSLNGHNVFLITKYSGVDPETNLRGDSNILGWDYFTLPSTRGWSLRLNATF